MSDIAIKTSGLAKRYAIGEKNRLFSDMRDTVSDFAAAPLRFVRDRVRRRRPDDDQTLWALRELDLEIKKGEIVGLIGRNGAGKSTLLKVLARITEPTHGYADIFGRVGSLLEVGTGFNYDLTGRENIFLSGAILGMKRVEITRRFDEIVAFAGIERFLDTPVKHYSSGMFLRLAFAVAAHLETEILLVDEILAVGDIDFQKKCLGKMDDVATQGRTVLFVSHNLAVIKQLCQTAVVLDQGRLDFRGSVVDGLAHYGRLLSNTAERAETIGHGWWGVEIGPRTPGFASRIANDKPLVAEAWLELRDDVSKGLIYCIIEDSIGETLVHARVEHTRFNGGGLTAGRYRVRADLPEMYLAPAVYSLHFKFIGQTEAGAGATFTSERILLDVTGEADGIGSARLAPSVDWSVTPALLARRRDACGD